MAASDVFLSYSRADAAAVEAVRARLIERGVSSFLDRTRLPAGQPWQPFLEKELRRAGAVAVFLGPRMGSWQHREVQVALDRQGREDDFPVIPILLPGLDDEPTGFLSLQTWIDLRADPSDPAQLQTLIAAIRRTAPEDASAELKASICPYRGLLPFREEDAGFFFGREQQSQDLLAKAQQHPVIAVIGRSGSGKSSLVFAGLFPRLRRSPDGTAWDMMVIRPGEDPLAALVRAISPPPEDASAIQQDASIEQDVRALRDGSASLPRLIRSHLSERSGTGTDRLLLYVDQWEELYTQARRDGDAARREEKQADVARFIDLLLKASADSPLTLVFTVRADFYDHLLHHDRLTGIAQDQKISLGPLTQQQLRDSIEQPARKIGLGFEDGLTDRIARDVGGDEGKLPLLEYALKGTWENSRNARPRGAPPLLTHAAYETAGRVEGAIADKADAVYRKLTDAQKDAARRLFVNLVTPGEGQADTRAIARLPDDPTIEQVVAAFSDRDHRLLVTGHDRDHRPTAEVSHEALIRNWGELRAWVEANRQHLLTRDRIAGAMRRWRDRAQPDDLLLSPGIDLEEGRQLLADHGDVAIDDIEPYIQRSDMADKTRKQQERAKERQHLRAVSGAIAALILLGISAVFGWFAWVQAETAQDQTRIAVEQRDLAREAERRAETAATAAAEAEYMARAEARRAKALESRLKAVLALGETKDGNGVNGMLLALRGIPIERTEKPWPIVTETRQALVGATLGRRELAILDGHQGSVVAARYSPDGARIISGSDDGTVRVWDAATAAEFMALKSNGYSVLAAGVSPDGTRIVSGSGDRTIRVWDAVSGAELLVLRGHDRGVRAAGFSPDGSFIVSGAFDGTVRLWDTVSGAELLVLSGHRGDVRAAGFSPDGARIISGSGDSTLRIWDATSGVELLVLPGHEGPVSAAGFSPNGTRIVSASEDHTLRIWDATSGAEQLVLKGHEGPVLSAEFSPDGARIISGSGDGTVRLWDATNGAELLVLRGHEGRVHAAAFSPDGTRIVSSSDDATIRVWDALGGADQLVLRGHEGAVNAAVFSPDGIRIVSGSDDGTIRVWDAASGEELLALEGHGGQVHAVGFSPDGTRIVSGSGPSSNVWNPAVRVWEARSGNQLLSLEGHDRPVNAAEFSPDGSRIVSASDDNTVRVWDAKSGAELLTLQGHEGPVLAAGFSPDGSRIVSASDDNTVRVWDATTGAELLFLPNHEGAVKSASFSPDGSRVVSGSLDGTVRVWDAASGAELLVLRSYANDVYVARFSADGARIASGSGSAFGGAYTVRVWDAVNGSELFILRGHEGDVNAAGFSPDGSRIVSGSSDGTIRAWFVGEDDAALVEHACASLPRDLSSEDIERFNLDPDAPWPCAERAKTLWPHPVADVIPASRPEAGAAPAQ